jgi:uncharacterized protein (DUF1697 family)
MATFVSMLRGVNVAGHKMLKMAELAEAYSSLGFADVRTYLQSGNVIFSASISDESSLVRKIQEGLKTELGLDVTVFIRNPKELGKVVAKNPFQQQKMIYISFLKAKPDNIPSEKLNSVRGPGEEFRIIDREVFLYLPNGSGRTKLSNNYLEKALGLPATTRNWNTVTALAEMSGPTSR